MSKRSSHLIFLTVVILLGWPRTSPAPLVYTPGEGWRYEAVGEDGSWVRGSAKEQYEYAKTAFEEKTYGRALKAAKRTVNVWPFSDYAPECQYLIGRCYEAKGKDEKAFSAYQTIIERYPKLDNYDDIVQRQFEIANRYLAGKWYRLWGYVPLYPSMDKTIKLYEQIIDNGPYSDVAPQAQMNIAEAHTQKTFEDYPAAAQAYERAADRYSNKKVGRDALYMLGVTYQKQARSSEYDQSIAALAIATLTDFITLNPNDERIGEARERIIELRTEQARGSFDIAKFYEKKRRWQGALIYYNEVLNNDRESEYADLARKRIATIQRRLK